MTMRGEGLALGQACDINIFIINRTVQFWYT